MAALILFACLIVLNTPKVDAAQSYGWIEVLASQSQVYVGQQFTVSVYVSDRQNSPFNSAEISIYYWRDSDIGGPHYNFVNFTPGNDFPVSDGSGVYTGAYGYQCLYHKRESTANMTGRHLFGTYTFKALVPGQYSIDPASPCRNKITNLNSDGFMWDYSGSTITIKNQPQPSSTTSPTNSPRSNTTTGSNQSSDTNTPSPSGDNTTSDTKLQQTATKPDASGPTKSASINLVGEQSHTEGVGHNPKLGPTDHYWRLIIFLVLVMLILFVWKFSKLKIFAVNALNHYVKKQHKQ